MPHGSVKIIPGVDTTRTPALNEAAISETNLIRFLPDRNGLGLPQKLGGWIKFFSGQFVSPIRDLHAWQDLNEFKWLAVGAELSLSAISNNAQSVITPEYASRDVAPDFSIGGGLLLGEGTNVDNFIITESTTPALDGLELKVAQGGNIVTIVDVGSDVALTDIVYIKTPVAVGGGIVYGTYAIYARIDNDTYQIQVDFNATENVENGGVVPLFETLSGGSFVTVTLANNGQSEGDTVAFLVPTTVGGITISGEYLVYSVIDVDQFTIAATNIATSTASGYMNGGDVSFYYFLDLGAGSGYGRGGYGEGGYGTGGSARTGTPIETTDWYLDNFGQLLIASPHGGAIYYWQPNGPSRTALVLKNAPVANNGVFVAMPQRQIIAFGSTFNGLVDPLLVRWCDISNPEIWNGQAINQAGSYVIPEGSKIISGIQAPQQTILWTDQSVWSMQYIGPPLVYAFNKIGTGVGSIAPKSVGLLNNVVYWMSESQFNLLSSNGVQTIACTVWDQVFQNLNQGIDEYGNKYTDRIRCATNSQFGEVTWYYPSANSTENDSYVKYNTQLQQWDYGILSRTAWIDQSVLGSPIGSSSDGYLYQHEIGYNNGDTVMLSSFKTGYFAISEADQLLFVDQIWPDMKWGTLDSAQTAEVNITFYGTNYPGDTPIVYGPFTMTQAKQYIQTRIRTRLLAIEISSNAEQLDSFWRMGNVRYRFQPDGRF